MLHGSMLRRKRSMLHTYALLIWLVAIETIRIAVRVAGHVCRWPVQLLNWLVTLQFLAPLVQSVAKLFHNTQRSRRAIVVFTRLPYPGRTKSRLIPYIGPSNSALVMRVLTESLIRRLQPLRHRLPDTDIYIAYKDQCHVVCEATVCNRPVQLWMECIDRHVEFSQSKSSSVNSNSNGRDRNGRLSTNNGRIGEGQVDDVSSEDGLHFNDAPEPEIWNGADGMDDTEDDSFCVENAMEFGAFERYLEQLKSRDSPPYQSAKHDPNGAPCRIAHLGPQPRRHRNGHAKYDSNGFALSSSSAGSAGAAAPLPQSGCTIGATLESALWNLFGRGYDQVVLLSSDVPALSDQHAMQALRCLDSGAGLVLGKTGSGGLYLLAASRRPVRRHLNCLFRNILWGSSTVFDCQFANALLLDIVCASLRPILRDLDTIDDLGLVETELGIPSCLFMSDTVTVLIPARNEADHIEASLRNLLFNFSKKRHLQIVIVDGRSVDGTVQVIREFVRHRASTCLARAQLHKVSIEVRRLPDSLPTGRGQMIRYGLQFARGAYYLVLHADSSLPENWDDVIVHSLSKPGIVAGAFTFHLKLPNELCFTKDIPWALRTLLLELHTNWRCRRYEMPIGSQGLFIHAYYYTMSGGYRDWPFLEDIEFAERVKQFGHVAIADAAVMTSPRRWITHGFLAVCGLNALILLAYRMGVEPAKLGAIYYSVGKSWVRV
ncbi:hypothetical protein BOX15_Mlig000337g1 [Macrostomum lignano]|uniref:Glycosyltransferase 2-like domain-containing protein n=1 Tax=Macrostomum lignano TaxID=282301 RepID=A0A267DQV8_9PLAT|nr:hypothetical protein BOX15_Mlig000337g2 [Macrostomum lignano]PAA51690.1 hypothetical protein BOX15_Mlig000337g1 [Macrostomum lignano]